MPVGFTFHYYFEFDGGNVTMRHLCSTSDDQAVYHQLCANPVIVKKAIVRDLFDKELKDATVYDLKLPRHPGNELPAKKLESLGNKYFSIPPEAKDYYPVSSRTAAPGPPLELGNEESNEPPVNQAPKRRGRKRKGTEDPSEFVAVGNRARPKKVQVPDSSQPSILRFFQ
eukprot:TRINITY_DN6582_c0_g1_i4.p1 TRINITY_DN6582_c0_g1~~TRINITY_DN6582_c0_g1_i4.p1  ORF type:complete len:170 (+),score=42.37 TRINITY_DN6582_c0_g1_i4:373-882(+)